MTNTTEELFNIITSLKHNEMLEFPYLPEAVNLAEEPFCDLFIDDKFKVYRDGDDILWEYIPAHDIVFNWDYLQHVNEFGGYASILFRKMNDKELQAKYPNSKDLADYVTKLLWSYSSFSDGCRISNKEGIVACIEEMERLKVDITKFELSLKKDV
jgi:hypothetical protein